MVKKRFTLVYGDENPFEWDLMDNQKDCLIISSNGVVICKLLNELHDKSQELKQLIKELEKQIYLIHMSSMFSTVKSFKGDVSKRYKYSEETDTIYDTANRYGQYYQILDKKEVVMLLNEYETLLEGDDD